MVTIKHLSKKLEKACVACGKEIKVILYQDRSYRGGHYFGKMSLSAKQGKKAEYWECPKCYWN